MSDEVKPVIPEGYLMDSRGRLVPMATVKTIDKLRNDLVLQIMDECLDLSAAVGNWKQNMRKSIEDFCALSAAEYGVAMGGKKGNITLSSYDGSVKVTVDVQESIYFDERLNVAKTLVDECLNDWTAGGRDEAKVLIQDAFDVKDGRVNSKKILGLRKFDFDDDRWKRAMAAIGEAVQVASSKRFLRVYRKNASEQFELVPLDGGNL